METIYNEIKLVAKQMILSTKSFFAVKSNIFLCAFFFIAGMALPMVFIPLWGSYGILLVVILLPLNATIYFSSNMSYRESTLYSNSALSKNNRWIFNTSTLLLMILASIASAIVVFIIAHFACLMDLMLIEWFKHPDSSSTVDQAVRIRLGLPALIATMYFGLFMGCMIFAISFMLGRFVHGPKVYFTVMLGLLIMTIIYGGAFNDYYWFKPDGMTPRNNGSNLFPWSVYFISFLFPFYSQGEFMNTVIDISSQRYNGAEGVWMDYYYATFGNDTVVKQILVLFGTNDSWRWNISFYFPWVEMVAFVGIGAIISKHNRVD